jgi:hypothetical protein
VLQDRITLNRERPRDQNVDDPYISFLCQSLTGAPDQPAEIATLPNGTRGPKCGPDTFPVGALDMKRAFAARDEHALTVCASRDALYRHMNQLAREAFGTAFAECGIQ